MPENKIRVASLFCGCGGSDLGLLGGFKYLGKHYKRLPFEIVYAIDNDKYAVETYNGWSWYDSDETRTGSGWNSQILEHKMNRKEGIQPLYTTVAKACLSRNRDLNGNGSVDAGEIFEIKKY